MNDWLSRVRSQTERAGPARRGRAAATWRAFKRCVRPVTFFWLPLLALLAILAIVVALASGSTLERNSLHPVAKVIVSAARATGTEALEANDVRETVGTEIFEVVNGTRFVVSKLVSDQGMTVGLFPEDADALASFRFYEQIKPDSQRVVRELTAQGFQLFVFTGDRRASAERVVGRLGVDIELRAECTPEDKQRGLALSRARHHSSPPTLSPTARR